MIKNTFPDNFVPNKELFALKRIVIDDVLDYFELKIRQKIDRQKCDCGNLLYENLSLEICWHYPKKKYPKIESWLGLDINLSYH